MIALVMTNFTGRRENGSVAVIKLVCITSVKEQGDSTVVNVSKSVMRHLIGCTSPGQVALIIHILPTCH